MADQPNRCKARQYSDQMYCPSCGVTWDTNDPEPPDCPEMTAHTHRCYQCDAPVNWLAPDGRCSKCTRLTPEQIRGDI